MLNYDNLNHHNFKRIARINKFKMIDKQDNQHNKVFFIGFHKTGTGYYNTMFRKLGFKVLHYWTWKRGNSLVIKRYDIFLDGCFHNYKLLHQRYPDAKDKLVKLFDFLNIPKEQLINFDPKKKENYSIIDDKLVNQYEQLALQAVRELNQPLSVLDQII